MSARHAGRQPRVTTRRTAAVVGGVVAALLAAGCGGTTSPSSSAIVATAPADGGGLTTATASTTGSGSGSGSGSGTGALQSGGIRTVLAPLGLNLRSQPSTTSTILGRLGEGTVVTVLGSDPSGTGWYQVKGATTTGWMTAVPTLSSPRHFQAFESQQHGFSTLYPDSWTFSDSGGAAVIFTPASATGLRITVNNGATLDSLGAQGKPGYAVSSGDSVEVFGVTGTLRTFDRGAGAPAGTTAPLGSTPTSAASSTTSAAGSPDTAPHLAEIRLAVNKTVAFRIDFEYQTPADLDLFRDVYNSMKIFAALPTPSPGPSPTL